MTGRLSIDSGKTLISGVLNMTPDSFSDGNMFFDVQSAFNRAKEMADQGADIIEVGGESTRPGSRPVTAEEELRRVLSVVKKIASELTVPVSIDTYKPRVAEECLKNGASMINDVTGLRNEAMIQVAAKYDATVVIMHMQGTPQNMQDNPQYQDLIGEINQFFAARIEAAERAGVNKIILDPGIGFGKSVEHNLEIIRRLPEFREFGCPLMIGTSRKSFIRRITGAKTNAELLPGTIASICIAVGNGADIVRVHDVKECSLALGVVDALFRR